MAEVAGIRPAQSGWAVAQFRPRLGLFRQLGATVPLKMTDGISTGVVHISWSVLGGEIVVRLQADLTGLNSIPVDIALPGQETQISLDKNGLRWVRIMMSSDMEHSICPLTSMSDGKRKKKKDRPPRHILDMHVLSIPQHQSRPASPSESTRVNPDQSTCIRCSVWPSLVRLMTV